MLFWGISSLCDRKWEAPNIACYAVPSPTMSVTSNANPPLSGACAAEVAWWMFVWFRFLIIVTHAEPSFCLTRDAEDELDCATSTPLRSANKPHFGVFPALSYSLKTRKRPKQTQVLAFIWIMDAADRSGANKAQCIALYCTCTLRHKAMEIKLEKNTNEQLRVKHNQ